MTSRSALRVALALASLSPSALAQSSPPLQVPSAYQTIQAAIDAAVSSPSTVIEVAAGTYLITTPIETRGKEFTLRGMGGAPATILDGGNVSRIFRIRSGETADTVIEGFTHSAGRPQHESRRAGSLPPARPGRRENQQCHSTRSQK